MRCRNISTGLRHPNAAPKNDSMAEYTDDRYPMRLNGYDQQLLATQKLLNKRH